MKKLVLIAALTLGGCSTIQTLQQVAGTAVTPTQALVAANAFDAAESAATAYLVYCKSNLTTAACSAATAISSSATIPATLYNALVAAVTNLKATPAANGGNQ